MGIFAFYYFYLSKWSESTTVLSMLDGPLCIVTHPAKLMKIWLPSLTLYQMQRRPFCKIWFLHVTWKGIAWSGLLHTKQGIFSGCFLYFGKSLLLCEFVSRGGRHLDISASAVLAWVKWLITWSNFKTKQHLTLNTVMEFEQINYLYKLLHSGTIAAKNSVRRSNHI